ncbi:MAG: HIT family protein [Candidatus Pacebacteria bacterium]|nr:HIT family protein [Candidatus Paceibacterota bacterium]
MSTVFSKIIAKEIPADIIYEDDIVLAFLDIQPVNLGHALVIPKTESVDGTVIEPDTLGHIMKVAQKVALAQKSILGCTGVNYIMNNGTDAGQEVFHTHLHVIPRYPDDGKFKTLGHEEYKEGESEELADKISSKL